ncbi:HIRAN domain-containing protein [Cryobacterium sp. Y50]|uniref:HIRAN domain-containing protein n=1 Tax=Cryobacterium sp. Y50 TaxID=2048286 RepID=UPI000CE31E66|nr:HIRAN domain-containing protein [Cryobacterium sp. Y50]
MSPLPKARVIATIYSCDCAKETPLGAGYFNLYGISEDQSVAGSSLYQKNISEAVRSVGPDGRLAVVLVPEPLNAHDKTAVRVDVLAEGRQLKAGYLPREDARKYFEVLSPLAESGMFGVTRARPFKGELGFRLYLRLESPDWCLPRSAPTGGDVVLVAERETVVTGVAQYQPALRRFHGRRKVVQKTFRLGIGPQPSGRHAGEVVIFVYAGDDLVGRLTIGKSMEYMAPVKLALACSLVPYAIGEISWTAEKGHEVSLLLPISKYRVEVTEYFYRDVSGKDALAGLSPVPEKSA